MLSGRASTGRCGARSVLWCPLRRYREGKRETAVSNEERKNGSPAKTSALEPPQRSSSWPVRVPLFAPCAASRRAARAEPVARLPAFGAAQGGGSSRPFYSTARRTPEPRPPLLQANGCEAEVEGLHPVLVEQIEPWHSGEDVLRYFQVRRLPGRLASSLPERLTVRSRPYTMAKQFHGPQNWMLALSALPALPALPARLALLGGDHFAHPQLEKIHPQRRVKPNCQTEFSLFEIGPWICSTHRRTPRPPSSS